MSRKIESSSQELSWGQHLQSLLPLLAVYLILAFYNIDRQSLWEDEFLSVQRVASPIAIWKDGHGFLYFALLQLWVRVGTSEFILRSLSVFLGAGAVCLTYATGCTFLNRRVAVIGTGILATSPYFIWYSQEVRYVTLMMVSTLLAMSAFHWLVSRPGLARWLVYSSTTLLALFSFLSTLFVPVAQGLFLLGSPSRRPLLRKWMVCQIIVFAFFTLWIINGTHYWTAFTEAIGSEPQTLSHDPKQKTMVGYTQLPPAPVPYTFFALSTGFSLGPSLSELHTARFAALAPYAPILAFIVVLFGSLFLLGLTTLWRRWREDGLLLALWIVVPILGTMGISLLTNMIYSVRYIAMVLPGYVLLLAVGIASFRRPVLQLISFGAVLAVHGLALTNYYFDPRYAREDTRSAARFLESAAGSQDVALVVGTASSLPHYYKGNLPFVDFSSLDGDGQLPPERLRKVTANHDRLWLVQIRPWQVDRPGRVKAVLDNTYSLVEQKHFPGVDIYGYKISKSCALC